MSFNSQLAEVRFGCGLSPARAAPGSAGAMLDGLTGPDVMAQTHRIDPFETYQQRVAQYASLVRKRRQTEATSEKREFNDQLRKMRRNAARDAVGWFAQTLLRCVQTETALRERLTYFWADHFTALGKTGAMRSAGLPYIESAIRPNIAGQFSDLLVAATTHPLMLHYLDQAQSVGPDSRFAKRRAGRGLNENLAREVLELHTLGVDGGYSQQDIRQLAELFTGMSIDPNDGFRFRPEFAEPGPETVLGRSYGGADPSLAPVVEFLQDVAIHPDTARHIARKLAVHFVSDQPDPELVTHLAERFMQTDGHLVSVYEALLEHPAAWQGGLQNVKPPFDFVASACRALDVTAGQLDPGRPRLLRRIRQPMARMGQPWMAPGGPDGWPEEDPAWITPQGLAARIEWAMNAPLLLGAELPDPREFHETALGPFATPETRFAALAAETRAEGVGLVLASPVFQRR